MAYGNIRLLYGAEVSRVSLCGSCASMKVVLDTNIFLSGLMLANSLPGKILSEWHSSSFALVFSEPMLLELARVLAYPEIRKRIDWTDEDIQRFISLLRFRAEVVDIEATHAVVPRDADDAPVLAALIASEADILVSCDEDLLDLRNDYAIETTAEFCRRL